MEIKKMETKQNNPYHLYCRTEKQKKQNKLATIALNGAIATFTANFQLIAQLYPETGMTDTESRETIAHEVFKAISTDGGKTA